MQLDKSLILNKFFLSLLGFNTFSELKDKLHDIREGFDADGRSYFAGILMGFEHLNIPPEDIVRYDLAIKEYTERLTRNRRGDRLKDWRRRLFWRY